MFFSSITLSQHTITWNEAVWHWWSVVYAVFSTGGDLGPVQSQLVEDLSNFCHSCGMLDCQSGFAETTGFREIQRDSKMLPLQHKHLPSALPSPLALGRTILFVLFISFHASSSVASRGATHRAALGFTVQDPSLLAKLR